MAKAYQLFSGSSGNSIYIGNNSAGILVDIGVSAKRCEYQLSRIGISTDSIKAIFVTHEHRDHVAGIRVFASKFNIPVFAAPETLEEMRKLEIINGKFDTYDIENTTDINGIGVEAFKNSHDSACCLGYKIIMPDGRKIAVCTDTGYVTDEAKTALSGTDMIFLESNHEISMLENGAYPYHLKRRILSAKGHLSNFAAGEFAKELLQSGTTRFVLSHLSRENNMPEIARQTTISALAELGAKENSDYRLYVSKPENDEGLIVL
ncbi:MAG: MBL fold metallo-hydrolase [Eubacterium sp.]|nr:MBL fold metallo-hydrolase [Eubacterium sp.]